MSRDPLGQRRPDAIERLDELGGRGVQIDRSRRPGWLPGGHSPSATLRRRASGIDPTPLLLEGGAGSRVLPGVG